MTDHHDFGDHHFEDDYPGGEFHHEEPVNFEEPEHLDHFDDFGHEAHEPHVDTPVEEHHIPTTEDVHIVDDHHDTALHQEDDPADVFPPPVDVGELPEPVDGFPWTDAATLGTPDLATHDTLQPIDPHELAEYAGTEIPPGADPWTVLADSDDPATSTLARFFHDTTE
jgi:hypothetical protein